MRARGLVVALMTVLVAVLIPGMSFAATAATAAPGSASSLHGSLWSDHVWLQWSTPDYTGPDNAAAGVRVLRGASPAAMAVIADLSPEPSSYNDPNVAEGVRYYQVERYNTAGSSFSAAWRMEIGKGAVTNLAVVPLARHLVVRWDGPTSHYGTQPTAYDIYLGTTSTNLALAATLPTSLQPTHYRISNVTPGLRRYAKVIVQYGPSNPGPASPLVAATASASQVLFRDGGSTCCIREMASTGGPSVPFRIPSNLDSIGQLVASPDGRKIAFAARNTSGGGRFIYQVTVESGVATQLTPATLVSPREPAWSRDGRTIAFTDGTTTEPHLKLLNVAARTVSTVANSADLEQPVFLTPTTLAAHRYTYPGAGLVKITTAGSKATFPGTAWAKHASVSPDGRKMAFALTYDGDHDILKVMTLGGSTITPAQPSGLMSTPSWSPDSTSLYLSAGTLSGERVADLHRVNLVTNTTTALTSNTDVYEDVPAFVQPDYTAPAVRITSPSTTSTTATSVKVAWSATDLQAGVLSSDVRFRRGYGAGALSGYSAPSGWSGTTATYKTLAVNRGYRYCFSVRSRDRNAVTSPWTVERCIRIY